MGYTTRPQTTSYAGLFAGRRLAALLVIPGLLAAACASTPDEGTGVSQQGLSGSNTCAPAPAAQANNATNVYYRYSTAMTWNAARDECAKMGGGLAVPTNDSTNESIRSIGGGANVMIGLAQLPGQTNPAAGWRTPQNTPPIYLRWNGGEPNDLDGFENGVQNCSRMYGSTGRWDDISCTNTSSPYVCQFSATPLQCPSGSTCSVATNDTKYRCACTTSGYTYEPTTNTCVPRACLNDANGQYAANMLCTSWDYNISKRSSFVTTSGVGALLGVHSISVVSEGGASFMSVGTKSIPNYARTLTQAEINALDTAHAGDFRTSSGKTSAVAGQPIEFGEDIGYKTTSCGLGYWPAGPQCATESDTTLKFPLAPAHETGTPCSTSENAIGLWVSGVQIFGWTDSNSYRDKGKWRQLANKFEAVSFDVCGGHAQQQGVYHHHGSSTCLAEMTHDTGSGHSPIYGYAVDGYPVYGPWYATSSLAASCWKTRDYDTQGAASGCGGQGYRTCQFIDAANPALGKTNLTPDLWGPHTDEPVENTVATSGTYFEDYYYDAVCADQRGRYLDAHNGHDHDGLGYHYHVTVTENADGTFTDVFPLHVGPTFYGKVNANNGGAICP